MAPRRTKTRAGELKRKRFVIDQHYTVDELEWNRIVGSGGIGRRLLDAMAEMSSGLFSFGEIRRIPTSGSERFEFEVDGITQSIQFEYDVSPTSTLLEGLRQLFVEVNTALRRAGTDWRFILTRTSEGPSRSCDYRLVLAPRAMALEHTADLNVVAGLDLKEFELEH